MKKIFTLTTLTAFIFSSSFAQTCDTLFNLNSPLDTPTVYLADTGYGAGYISGNNEYGDIAKAEGFPATVGDYVNSVTLYFGIVSILPADSNVPVTVAIWDNTGISGSGATGAPGNIIDTADITLGQIAQAVNIVNFTDVIEGLLVNFTGGVAITTDTIYAGIILPTTGDTIALFTNIVPPGPDGNGWEYGYNSDGTGYVWGSYNNDWGFTNGSLGNYIGVDICNSSPSGAPAASFTASNTTNNVGGCTPDTIYFSDTSPQLPTGWSWSFGDGTFSNVQNPIHIYGLYGAYTVTESVTNILNGAVQVYLSSTQQITINPSPSASIQVTDASSSNADNGGATVIVTGGTPSYTYVWSNDNSTSDTIADVNPGTYNVTVTDRNSCTASATASVYVTGITNLSDGGSMKVFPNPAYDQINLQWNLSDEAEVTLYDVTACIIRSFTIQGTALNSFDIHDLPAGAYVLRVTDRRTSEQHSTLFTKL